MTLQVGLSMGVLSPGTYGLLVVMALMTTLAAGPLATRALATRALGPRGRGARGGGQAFR